MTNKELKLKIKFHNPSDISKTIADNITINLLKDMIFVSKNFNSLACFG